MFICCIRLLFESAEAAAGLELSVTGVLGFRTLHQVVFSACGCFTCIDTHTYIDTNIYFSECCLSVHYNR